ncbi:hypothetical protein [Actinoplanes regularis]|uniref:hypothetical protein n=1 Tax=Actinoplanes regularis TaxID=52697 RepID=UPI0024A21875|nr:hypothetical protein [Actinoplanes regularis]GLW29148.1 hypothetical protein Areg01_20880 [Actinoplanes regularis]
MFQKLKVFAILVAAVFGLLALGAPAQAASGAPKLTAAEASARFKLVPVKGVKRLPGPTTRLQEACGVYAPAWTVTYVPTNTPLFTQSTDVSLCIDPTIVTVTRLQQPTIVTILQLTGGLDFSSPGVIDNAGQIPGRIYNAQGVNSFTYCPPNAACASATHVVQAVVQGDGAAFTRAFFV